MQAESCAKVLDSALRSSYNMVPIWNHIGGSVVATITVKNIPDELYERLKMSAQANHRSINSEIIVCIERAVGSRRVDPEGTLAGARLLRERSAAYPITDEELTRAKDTGRP